MNCIRNTIKSLFLLVLTCLISDGLIYAGDIIKVDSRNKSILPKGKEADGMAGDWIMKNDMVIAVIASAYPDREANQMVSSIQGAVIDFTTLSSNNDQLVVYYPQGARVDVPAADTIIILKSKGNVIQLKAVKNATRREPYIAETTYTLRDGNSYLEVSTEYRNTSAGTISIKPADKLRCDNDIRDVSPEGNAQLSYIYSKWFNAAYGIAVISGSLFTVKQAQKPKLTDVGLEVYFRQNGDASAEPVLLPPGDRITFSRILLTGNDIADLQRESSSLGGPALIEWKVQVNDTGLKRIADAFVSVNDLKGGLVSASKTDSNGNAKLYLAKGDYRFHITRLGHDTVFQNINLAEKSNGSIFTLQPETSLAIRLSCPDGNDMPVKIEIRGRSGTRDPFLGPFKRSNGAGNLYFSNRSAFEIPVPPGNYEVAFSHGPEYDVVLRSVSIKRGETGRIDVVMKRSFATPGWIIADLHNHTTGSGDSGAEIEGRIINMAAAGIEFAPATEHNRISTFSGVIEEIGLKKYIASSPGVELSGRPGPGDINHQNGFPVKDQDGKRGFGAPKTDRDPYVQMKRLYDYDNGAFKFMQQNHPNISWLYFDKDRDGVADKGFGTSTITDALEINGTMVDFPGIINGKTTRSRLLHWLQMLNLGYHIFATANSDAHAVGHGSGSVFSYIRAEKDKPETINDAEIAREAKKGHIVISNGPFLEVTANGALPGDAIRVSDGKVNMKIRAFAANWCRINTVQIIINGRASQSYTFSMEKNAGDFSQGPCIFDREITVSLAADAHLIVVACGKGESVGKVQGGPMRNAIPIAISNPVFVDTDGNGFVPNKDLLDNPIPTSKAGKTAPSEED